MAADGHLGMTALSRVTLAPAWLSCLNADSKVICLSKFLPSHPGAVVSLLRLVNLLGALNTCIALYGTAMYLSVSITQQTIK